MTDFETTAEERSSWLRDARPYGATKSWWLGRLLRDVNRALAESARLKTREAEREAWRSRAEKRQNELAAWIDEHAPYIAAEQKHLDDGSTQQAYWHYGYLIALRDLGPAP